MTPQRLWADPHPGSDETAFHVDNTSASYYSSPYYLAHKNQLQPFPKPPIAPLEFASVAPDLSSAAVTAKKIAFHAVGDTGAAKVNHYQTAAQALRNQALVADMMAADIAKGSAAPSFFFHLGDIIYHFGEDREYYDQFYEPFRAYDRPIFAIPGNHDGAVFGQGVIAPQVPSLQGFMNNFCAPAPGPATDASGLVRSLMTQPGPYWTLDAPFLSIVGLYSNVLEGPGIISSQGKKYPVGDDQLNWLVSELKRLKPEHDARERAVVIAVHHPPASVDTKSGGTLGLALDLDSAYQSSGLVPDAVLSGHAHLYERFTHTIAGKKIPYVVAGSGGYNASAFPSAIKKFPFTRGAYTLEKKPDVEFGYSTVTVDMSARPSLTIDFHGRTGALKDTVTVTL